MHHEYRNSALISWPLSVIRSHWMGNTIRPHALVIWNFAASHQMTCLTTSVTTKWPGCSDLPPPLLISSAYVCHGTPCMDGIVSSVHSCVNCEGCQTVMYVLESSWVNEAISNSSVPREHLWATNVCRSAWRFAHVEEITHGTVWLQSPLPIDDCQILE